MSDHIIRYHEFVRSIKNRSWIYYVINININVIINKVNKCPFLGYIIIIWLSHIELPCTLSLFHIGLPDI